MIDFEPLPIDEAIGFWRGKVQLSPRQFAQLADEAKNLAFAVSGIAKGDELAAVFEALNRAIAKGDSFGEFKKQIRGIVERRGWTGKKAWRVANIFRTNIQTAYSAGRYRQMMEVRESRPYWQYSAVNDARTRPTHLALNGLVFPADHAFWKTWYPPNGYNCFPPGTPVLTPSGWRDIAAIRPKDRVVGGSGHDQLVTSVHRNRFDGHLVRLVFEGGCIAATPNHRILTVRGWVRADALQTGDVLVETLPLAAPNAAVRDEDLANAKNRDGRVAPPVQGKAAVAFAADGQIETGNEDVEPLGAQIGMGNVVVNGLETQRPDVVEHQGFRASRGQLARGVFGRVTANEEPMGNGGLYLHFRASRRCGLPELFRRAVRAGIRLLRLAETRMAALAVHARHHAFHGLGGLDPALLGGMYPLGADGIAALSGFYPEVPEKSHQRPRVETPSLAQVAVGPLLADVATVEDFGDGGFLDAFDTLDDFKAWSRLHAVLRKVLFVEKLPYNGTVFNLSVENDHAYIVRGATVHNCRCGVVTLSKGEMEREGLKPETQDPTGRLIEPVDPKTGNRMPARPLMPDPGFAHNPGETVWGGLVDAAARPGVWKALPGLKGPSDYRRRALENVRPAEIADFDETMLLPRGKGDAFYQAEFRRLYGEEKLLTDAAGEPVILSLRSYLADKTPGAKENWKFSKGGHGESIPLLERMIVEPYEIWLAPQINEAGRIRLAKRYIGLWKTADKRRIGGYASFEVADGVYQGVTAFIPLRHGKPAVEYVEGQRQGLLLFQRGR